MKKSKSLTIPALDLDKINASQKSQMKNSIDFKRVLASTLSKPAETNRSRKVKDKIRTFGVPSEEKNQFLFLLYPEYH